MNARRVWHLWDLPDSLYFQLALPQRRLLFHRIYRCYGSRRHFADAVSLGPSTIKGYERGFTLKGGVIHEQAIPIRLLMSIWKIFGEKDRQEIEAGTISLQTRAGGRAFLRLPIVESPSLYSLVGHMLADGSASSGKTPFYANTQKCLRVEVMMAFQYLGDVPCYERSSPTVIHLCFPKVITDILAHILHIDFTRPDRIPSSLFETRFSFRSSFLRAIFDDEGTCSTGLVLTMHSSQLLKQIKYLLQSLEISTGRIVRSLYTTKRGVSVKTSFAILSESIDRYRQLISFTSPHKREMLEYRIHRRNRRGRTLPEIQHHDRVLDLVQEGLVPTIEIANRLQLGIAQTRKHLIKMESEGLLLRSGYQNRNLWSIKDAPNSSRSR